METNGNTINVAKLLSGLGINAVDTQDAVAKAVQAEIDSTGAKAEVTGVRWGAAHIEGGQEDIAALLWHRDKLAEKAAEASSGEITRVVMKVRR